MTHSGGTFCFSRAIHSGLREVWTHSQADPTQVLSPSIDHTVLQIRGLDDTLKSTITIDGSTPPYTISNAHIIAALGGELSFRLRAYFRRKYGWPSLRYDTTTVTKV